jgi:SAM-dependent methyltransferase
MKENKYDDPAFFEAYSNFPRSVRGLAAAGEWHELKKLLPDFAGKRVLDIGCGFGWHCIYAAQQGAKHVTGTDISEKMLAVARQKTSCDNVEYQKIAMEDIDYPENSFDVAMSSLAFHYTLDFDAVCTKVHKCLAVSGTFVFSVEHPVFTAYGTQDWMVDSDGNIVCWPVDRYFMEGKRNPLFLGEEVVKYHRTFTTYMNTLMNTGFAVTGFTEPQPEKELIAEIPGMENELRRPMMLIIAAQKL